MMDAVKHWVASRSHEGPVWVLTCSCGALFEGSKSDANGLFSMHRDEVHQAKKASRTGPEAYGKRPVDDGLAVPLHVMARRRGA